MTTMIVDELGRIPMSPYLTATLTRAADYATAQSHREVTLEHLLLALSEDPEATVVLKSSHIDLARLTADVNEHLARSGDRVAPGTAQPIVISADLKRILEAAAAAAQQGRRREINGAIVLAAIVGDGRSMAAHFLRVQGLTFEEAIRALKNVTSAPSPPAEPAPPPPAPPVHVPAPPASSPPPVAAPAPAPVAPPPVAPPPAPAERIEPSLPDPTRPPTTEEILASARERLQQRSPAPTPAPHSPEPAPPPVQPVTIPRTNLPDLGAPRPAAPPSYPFDDAVPQTGGRETGGREAGGSAMPGRFDGRFNDELPAQWAPSAEPAPPPHAPQPGMGTARHAPQPDVPPTAPPRPAAERRRASSGPFVGSWPLIEAGQLVENISRRMRVGVPVVVEARIARADVKALAEGLQGSGAAFRHEVVVTKAMSVRLRAPEGGFSIENRSPETQWIENVLGLSSDDFASWRWTVTPRSRGRRQLQLIVSARTVGADGTTAETALPDQTIDVKVAINYARTFGRWLGWITAAVLGGLLAKFGETGFVILKLLIAKYLGI